MGHFGMLKGDPRGGRVRQYGDISILWGGRILERPASPDPGMDGITSSCCDRLGKEENEYERRYFRGGFPRCQNASRPSLLASSEKGRLDPSRGEYGGRKREMKETEEREAALPGTGGILRDSWRRYNFSSFSEILSFSTISSRHIPFRQCQ